MINGEDIARLFHETYEKLAPSFGYETREDTKVFDPESKNGKLMISVCQSVASKIYIEAHRDGYIEGYSEGKIDGKIECQEYDDRHDGEIGINWIE
jgi:hypothetical protein